MFEVHVFMWEQGCEIDRLKAELKKEREKMVWGIGTCQRCEEYDIPEEEVIESERLEGEAVKLYRKGKLFFDANAKKFFRDVADFNQWENLKKELDK